MTVKDKTHAAGKAAPCGVSPQGGTQGTAPVGPLSMLHGLHGLWSARVISQDALFLGAQVCHRMLMHKTTTVEHTGTLAQSHYTMLSGAIYTGPIVKDLLLYVAALQDLHFRGGLVNDLVVPDTKDPDVQRSHFTLSPNWIAGEHYDMDTSICFKIMPMSKDEFFLHINKLVSGSLGHCRPYSFDEE